MKKNPLENLSFTEPEGYYRVHKKTLIVPIKARLIQITPSNSCFRSSLMSEWILEITNLISDGVHGIKLAEYERV
jgi:hypothetical protein